MFFTDRFALATTPDGDDADSAIWDYIELRSSSPWFLVTVDYESRGLRRTDSAQMASWRQVRDLVWKQWTNLGISEVQLVSPPSVNGSTRWQMEPLSTIEIAVHATTGGWHCIYTTLSGAAYVPIPAEAVRERYKVFSRSALEPLAPIAIKPGGVDDLDHSIDSDTTAGCQLEPVLR